MNRCECHFVLLIPSHTIWTRYEYEYWKWMQAETPTDWAETSTPELGKGTRSYSPITKTNGQNIIIYHTLDQPQQFVEVGDAHVSQSQQVILRIACSPNY